MSATLRLCHWAGASCLLPLLLLLTGCAHSAGARREPVQCLQAELTALSPMVCPDEAWRAAVCAHDSAEQLAREYRVVRPAIFHNFLVNIGIRERGLCYHWAGDLFMRLEALRLRTLELHWGSARAGTLREHNSVVVTAQGQPFDQGIVLDGWRHLGCLYWARVSADRYPWKERMLASPPPALPTPAALEQRP